jgi:hypothetical protein
MRRIHRVFLWAYGEAPGLVRSAGPGDTARACALHVEQMLEQHRQVGVLLADIEPVRLRWMKTADARDRDDLAGRYGDLSAVLNVHLSREVTEVMPAVDKMTQKELTTAAEHGTGQFSAKFLIGYLGMVLASNPPGEREELFKEMPAPVRMGYRAVGRGMYRRQYSALFPGRPVPETL